MVNTSVVKSSEACTGEKCITEEGRWGQEMGGAKRSKGRGSEHVGIPLGKAGLINNMLQTVLT